MRNDGTVVANSTCVFVEELLAAAGHSTPISVMNISLAEVESLTGDVYSGIYY